VADNLGMHEKQSSLVFLIKNLWECFVQRDALRIQLNPLIFSTDKKFYVGNCTFEGDDNASYR
jgi:succinyl-CoA synthetase beta subunit